MADKDKKPLAGFDILADFIVGSKNKDDSSVDDKGKSAFLDIDPDDLQKQMLGDDADDDKDDQKKDDKLDDNKDDKLDDDKKDDQDDDKKDDKKDDDDIKTDEDKEYESEISTFFASELAKKLKLEVDEDDLKFESVDDVLELMTEIVNENSKPTYASDEVEAYDEFVRNGGDLKDFYKEVYSGKLDVAAVDLEKEYDQRAVVRENLLNQGYKEEKIKKMISRYEEAETLKEEAEDALELLTEFNEKKSQSLLVQQKKVADDARKQQQKFFEDVNTTIKSISDIRGFPITEKQKRELLQYAFAPEEDGFSKYQKEYRTDVMNILESAFFAMNKKQKLADDAGKKGNSDAYKTLRDKLKAKGNKQQVKDNQKSNKLDRGSLGDFGKGIIF